MIISSGKFKGRRLEYPKDRFFRPTKTIVREAVFNILGQKILGASFLDCCSGSGAMGFEAESLGALSVVCVDKNIRYLLKNKKQLLAKARVVKSDIIKYLRSLEAESFNIIYLDPVWADHDTYYKAFDIIFEKKLCTKSGCLIVEHDNGLVIPKDYIKQLSKPYQYGNSILTIFKLES